MKKIISILLILFSFGFKTINDDEINELYASNKFQECANILRNETKNYNYVHFKYAYKLAACYSNLNKYDSAYFQLKKIDGYFNTIDATYPVTSIPSDYYSFHAMMKSKQWKKICSSIKSHAIKDHSDNTQFSFFYDIEINDALVRNKLNYFQSVNDKTNIQLAQEEISKTDKKNIALVSEYLNKHILSKKEINYNWAIINLIIHRSNDISLKEKYVVYFAENVKRKKLNVYAFVMFYTKLLEQKGLMKGRNLSQVQDSIINSFNH